MADEFEQVNPITRRVLAGEMTRRQLGTFYKFMKYEDQDMNDVIGYKRDIQGPDARGHIKWDLTREGHRKFQSLVKFLELNVEIPKELRQKPRTPTTCTFESDDADGVSWRCNNERIADPITDQLRPTCGWHCIECIGRHNQYNRPIIKCANADGLCIAHYFGKHDDEPTPRTSHRVPGMCVVDMAAYLRLMEIKEKAYRQRKADQKARREAKVEDQLASIRRSQEEEAAKEAEDVPPAEFDAEGDFEELDEEMAREFDDDVMENEKNAVKERSKLTTQIVKLITYKIPWFFKYYRRRITLVKRVQTFFRMHRARKRWKKIKRKKWQTTRSRAIIMLQAVVKGALERARVQRMKARYLTATSAISTLVKKFLRKRRTVWRMAAQVLQRVYRGHLARELARIERFRLANMAEYMMKLRLALILQRLYRGWVVRTSIRPFWQGYEKRRKTTVQIQKYMRLFQAGRKIFRARRKLHPPAVIMQKCVRFYLARKRFDEMFLERSFAARQLQRVYRAYRVRRIAFYERARVRKAWAWLHPARKEEKDFHHLLARADYLSKPLTLPHRPYWLNTRFNQVDDLIRGAFPKSKKKGEGPLTEALPPTKKQREEEARKKAAMAEYKRIIAEDEAERNASRTFQGKHLTKEDMDKIFHLDDTKPELPRTVHGIYIEKEKMPKLRSSVRKPMTPKQARRRYRKQVRRDRAKVDKEDKKLSMSEKVWHDFGPILGKARSEETYQQQFLQDPNSTMYDFVKTFKITRPIPLVKNGAYDMTLGAADFYMEMLSIFTNTDLLIADNEPMLVQLCMNAFTFLERHWKRLVKDVRNGTLCAEVPVSKEVRANYFCEPLPELAEKIEAMLRRLNFHGRTAYIDERFKGLQSGSLAPDAVKPKLTQQRIAIKKRFYAEKAKKMAAREARRVDLVLKRTSSDSNLLRRHMHGRPGSAGAVQELKTIVPGSNVHAMNYEFTKKFKNTRSRIVEDPSGRVTGRYVCDFPGCGHTFNNADNAERHRLYAHKGAKVLRTTLPLVDQRITPFWPPEAHFHPKTKEVTGIAERTRKARKRKQRLRKRGSSKQLQQQTGPGSRASKGLSCKRPLAPSPRRRPASWNTGMLWGDRYNK